MPLIRRGVNVILTTGNRYWNPPAAITFILVPLALALSQMPAKGVSEKVID